MSRFAVWLHQFDNGYPGLVGSDDSKLPIREVYGKTNDGTRFQSTWDHASAAIDSAAKVTQVERDIYRPQGIGYTPWGVVQGRSVAQGGNQAVLEGDLVGRIATAGAFGNETPVFILDLEPHEPDGAGGAYYWRDDLGAGQTEVGSLIRAFRAACPNGELWLAPDARAGRLSPVSFSTWVNSPYTTRCMPQVYFTDFVKPRIATIEDAKAAIDNALAQLDMFGWHTSATIFPIFPGDAAPAVMIAAIQYAHDVGCGGYSIWQRGNLRQDVADAIAAFADPWGTPAPTVPIGGGLGGGHVDIPAAIAALDQVDAASRAARIALGG